MVVANVKLHNIKVIEDIDLDIQGRDVLLVADSEGGKSTVIDTIKASVGIIPYPKDSLRNGKEKGGTDTILHDPVTGLDWIIKRDFTSGNLRRFDVVTSDGVPHKWTDMVKDLFNGVDPQVSYFDWGTYFYEMKTPKARFDYAMKCVLGNRYDEISEKVEMLEEERGTLGTEKSRLQTVLQGSEITEENYEELQALYKEPRENHKAAAKRDALLETRPKIPLILVELKTVKEENEKYTLIAQQIADIESVIIPQIKGNIEKVTINLDVMAKIVPVNHAALHEYKERKREFPVAIAKDDVVENEMIKLINNVYRILETQETIMLKYNSLAQELADRINELTTLKSSLQDLKLDIELENSLHKKLEDAERVAKEIELKAQQQYDEAVDANGIFNFKRKEFFIQEASYKKLQDISQKWIEKDNLIKDLKLQCIQDFKKKINMEKVEIMDIVTTGKENGKTVEKVQQHLYYDGRELNRQNVSTGLSMKIAIQFQMIHNPRFRTVFISDRNALGSKFDEVIAVASELGFQWIAEMTQPHETLKIEFYEKIVKPDRSTATSKKGTKSKK